MGIIITAWALPLNQLQSLRDRNPRGVTTLPLFTLEGVPKGGGSIYTARDHCFVIASMGINEKRAAWLFYLMFALWAIVAALRLSH